MPRGKLVVVEGGEGSGKTTHLDRLRKVSDPEILIVTREPGGSEMAEKIRAMIFSEEGKALGPEAQFHLFWAARADHLEKKILPALERGINVVSDRFDMSTFAYQVFGYGHHGLMSSFRFTRDAMLSGKVVPRYIYLDVDPKVGLARKHGATDGNHFDKKDIDFHERVRRGYREFSGIGHVIEIDASGTAEEVWKLFYGNLLNELMR